MKLIVAGSRTITDFAVVCAAIEAAIAEHGLHVDEVVSGGSRGVDTLGERWATNQGLTVTRMPADWETHGRRAGFLRNVQMAVYAAGGALVAIWDGKSRGTAHMVNLARAQGLLVYIHEVPTHMPVTGVFRPQAV